eukprot:gene525-1938_t
MRRPAVRVREASESVSVLHSLYPTVPSAGHRPRHRRLATHAHRCTHTATQEATATSLATFPHLPAEGGQVSKAPSRTTKEVNYPTWLLSAVTVTFLLTVAIFYGLTPSHSTVKARSMGSVQATSNTDSAPEGLSGGCKGAPLLPRAKLPIPGNEHIMHKKAHGSIDTAVQSAPLIPGAKLPIPGDEHIMRKKAHGTTDTAVQSELRYGCDQKTADKICSFNRHYAEHSGYWLTTKFLKEVDRNVETTFYDSVSGKPLFIAPRGRTFAEFEAESRSHGWPSFRDEEVAWDDATQAQGTFPGHLPPPSFTGTCHSQPLLPFPGPFPSYFSPRLPFPGPFPSYYSRVLEFEPQPIAAILHSQTPSLSSSKPRNMGALHQIKQFFTNSKSKTGSKGTTDSVPEGLSNGC